MTKRIGGTTAQAGFYWNLGKWEMQMLRLAGPLPGGADDRYLKLPTLALLLLAPMMGAFYIIFLPFIGFAMVLGYAVRHSGSLAQAAFMGIATVVAPHWQPGEAYLARRQKERQARRAKKDAKKNEHV